MNTYVPIFRGLDASGGRKQRTNRHTHARTHAHTRDNYSNPRCAHARRGLIKHSDLCRGLIKHSDLYQEWCQSSYNGLGSYTKKLRQTSVTISFQFCVDIIQFNYLFQHYLVHLFHQYVLTVLVILTDEPIQRIINQSNCTCGYMIFSQITQKSVHSFIWWPN